MKTDAMIAAMERFGDVLPAMLRGVSAEDARWKPASGAWSILEVVTHLADEEVEDFRARLRHTLERREGAWPAIDPEGWAVQRQYNAGNLGEQLSRFVTERAASLAWLRGLGDVDWNTAYQHSKWGPMPAGLLLASWAAHDLLHQRQITKRLYELVQRDAGPYETRYAGEWGA